MRCPFCGAGLQLGLEPVSFRYEPAEDEDEAARADRLAWADAEEEALLREARRADDE
jgi:hypothetical protein